MKRGADRAAGEQAVLEAADGLAGIEAVLVTAEHLHQDNASYFTFRFLLPYKKIEETLYKKKDSPRSRWGYGSCCFTAAPTRRQIENNMFAYLIGFF